MKGVYGASLNVIFLPNVAETQLLNFSLCREGLNKSMIEVDGLNIFFTEDHPFVGIQIDSKLNWKPQLDIVVNKLRTCRLQKRAIRTLANLSSDENCKGDFQRLFMLTLLKCIVVVVRIYDSTVKGSDIHKYETGNKDKIGKLALNCH